MVVPIHTHKACPTRICSQSRYTGGTISQRLATRRQQLRSQIINSDASLNDIVRALKQPRAYPHAPSGFHPHIPLSIGEHEFSYALYIPQTYNPSRSLPLVICLHEGVLTEEGALEPWIPRLGGDTYVLVCPTLDFGQNRQWWTVAGEILILATLQDVTRHYHADLDRIFLTGLSNGDVGAYINGMHRADRFAGIVPIAGCLPDTLYPLIDNLQHTPVYAIHGLQNPRIPPGCSRKIVKAIQKRGYPLRLPRT